METFELLKYGGREGKGTFRVMTLEEAMLVGGFSHIWIKANDGSARRVKVNSKVKRWKTNPNRFEVSLKYGMHEHARFGNNDRERMLIEIPPAPKGWDKV